MVAINVAWAAQSTVALQSSANPATFGHAVTLTATVSPSAATGPVAFVNGTSILGTSYLFNGQASLTTTLLPAGVQSLSAVYEGNTTYTASTSAVLKETVAAVPGNGFQPIVNYPSVTNATAVAVGDFNGDGHPDLVIVNANLSTGQIIVMLGIGDGTFKLPGSYEVDGANSVAVGDFNGDGRVDLAVVSGTSSNVFILLGNGDGTFRSAGVYGTALNPTGIAAGDLTGTGIIDLVVTTPSGVSVLIGLGDGSYRPSVFYNTGLTYSAAIADFNGDGRGDVVVANPNGVGVLLGIGDGTFLNLVTYPTGLGGGPIIAADFNGDGRMDIAAAAGGSTSVLLGKGDGTFQKPILSVSSSSNASIQTMAVGDFNGDGILDLANANSSGGPNGTNVSILLGNGDGSFQTPAFYTIAGLTFAAVSDFNGDGAADVVTLGLGPLGVMLGIPMPSTGTGNPPPPPPPPTGPTVAAGGVLDAASFAKDAKGNGTGVAPGSLASIFGTFPGAVQADASAVPFGPSLGSVTVTFNGISAPIRDVIPAGGQINVQVPFELAATGSSAVNSVANVVVTTGTGPPSAPVAVPILPVAPGIFTIPPTGAANAVLVFVDSDGIVKIAAPTSASASIGLPTGPIPRGQPGFFYATGLGVMNPPISDGDGGLEPPLETHFASTPIVTIGGLAANVAYAGQAPGYPGVNQINITVPAGAPTGDAVPIQIKTADGTVLSNIATIAIR